MEGQPQPGRRAPVVEALDELQKQVADHGAVLNSLYGRLKFARNIMPASEGAPTSAEPVAASSELVARIRQSTRALASLTNAVQEVMGELEL